jgi:hypothetical protein
VTDRACYFWRDTGFGWNFSNITPLLSNYMPEHGAAEDIKVMLLKFYLDLTSRHMFHECLTRPKVLNQSTVPFFSEAKHTFTNFSRLTTSLGAQGQHLVIYEASPPRLTNASWVLDIAQSAQGLGLVLTFSFNLNLSTQLKDFARKAWISQREFGESSRGCWNTIQMMKNQQPTREGVEALL